MPGMSVIAGAGDDAPCDVPDGVPCAVGIGIVIPGIAGAGACCSAGIAIPAIPPLGAVDGLSGIAMPCIAALDPCGAGRVA